jgi:cation/acetate symporter
LLAPKIATAALGVLMIVLGIFFKGQNIALLSLLGATIPASTLFPVLFLALYWRRLSTSGAVAGLVGGLIATIVLLALTPLVQVGMLGQPSAILPMQNVTIIALPLTFLITIMISLLKPDRDGGAHYHGQVRPRMFGMAGQAD